MIESKTEIISRIPIRPSIPTPLHLRTYKLSLLDQVSPHLHNILTFFYHSSDHPSSTANSMDTFSTRSQLLQKSLSETLSRFYPLAGRFEDDATIICNDEGAVFFEARTDMSLSNFLTHPDLGTISSQYLLAIDEMKTSKVLKRPLLVIGFSLFSCGGNVLSICITHKNSDLASVITLVKSWTGVCRLGTMPNVVPDLNIAASVMPPQEITDMPESVVLKTNKMASRRIVFRASKIGELKAMVLSACGKQLKSHPSRVDVAAALIWKCAMAALKSKTGKFKPTVLIQAVNLRTRMNPPLPESSMGNLAWLFPLTVENESEMEVQELVKKMIEWKASVNKQTHKFNREDIVETVKEGLGEREQLLRNEKDLAVYLCASWCKFPMLETDFGWGKPVWVGAVDKRNLMGNTIHLLDTMVTGEVEALVHLEEEEMSIFEQNQELLHFALLDPPMI